MDVITAPFSQLIVGVEHLRLAHCYILAPIVVLYYDWLLTLPLEIDRFWRRRLTGPTVLFMLNRYLPIVSLVPEMLAYYTGTFSPEVCVKHVVPFVVASNVISQSLIGIILLLRTYALYERSIFIFWILFISLATAVAVGIWAGSSLVPLSPFPGYRDCMVHVNASYRLASGYVASLLYDALVYGLTLYRTLFLKRQKVSNTTLISLIARDGSVYFVVLLGSNLLTILLICLAEPNLRTLNLTFNHLMPVVITSRLLLNIRRDNLSSYNRTLPSITRSTTVVERSFTTALTGDLISAVMGNIGEDFEEDSSRSGHSWSTKSSTLAASEEPYYIDFTEDSEEICIDTIEVSELRTERERIFGWDQIWAAGVNG